MMKGTTKKIAILGSTSHIAKGLIYNFNKLTHDALFLFARSPQKIKNFINEFEIYSNAIIEDFEKFKDFNYDCIINCVGIGRSSDINNVLELTEKYDNLILSYLQKNKNCLYINFSSGAVYGDFKSPLDLDSVFSLKINNIKSENFYSIAKINSETKHRALENMNIVDLRVFSYFSQFIDLNSGFLLTEVIKSIKNNITLKTNSENIVRDYSNPFDIFTLISKCIEKKRINDVYDVYSKKPISKFEILDFYSKNYGLKYVIENELLINNSTGNKSMYYSNYHKAKEIGFKPTFSSIEAIDRETKYIFTK